MDPISKGTQRLLECDVSSFHSDPSSFVACGWFGWKGPAEQDGRQGDIDHDDRSLRLKMVDWCKIVFKNHLREGEDTITGEENLKRQKAAGHVRLGWNVFLSLWFEYEKNKKNSVLEWLYNNRGVSFIDFFGLILRHPDGRRCVLYLFRQNDNWQWYFRYLDDYWYPEEVSGVPTD